MADTDIHVLHIRDGARRWWVIADKTNIVRGLTSDSKDEALAKWEKRYGRPLKLVTYDESYSMAEAAATLADLQGGAPDVGPPHVEQGWVKLVRHPRLRGHLTGATVYDNDLLTRSGCRRAFPEADYDRVLSKLSDIGFGIELADD